MDYKKYDGVELATIIKWYDDGELVEERLEDEEQSIDGEYSDLYDRTYAVYLHRKKGGAEVVLESEDAKLIREVGQLLSDKRFDGTIADMIIE